MYSSSIFNTEYKVNVTIRCNIVNNFLIFNNGVFTMNRKLYNLLIEKEKFYSNGNNIVKDYFISLIKKNPFKFLYTYDYIFCVYYQFDIRYYINKTRLNHWCSLYECEEHKIIKARDCNCRCRDYAIYGHDYDYIPCLYDLMDYFDCRSILTYGISL